MKRKKMLVKKQTNKQKKLLNCVLLCNRLYSSGLCLPYPGHVLNLLWPKRRKSQQQSARNKASSETQKGS